MEVKRKGKRSRERMEGWKEVIWKRRKERRLKIMEGGNGRREEAKNM